MAAAGAVRIESSRGLRIRWGQACTESLFRRHKTSVGECLAWLKYGLRVLDARTHTALVALVRFHNGSVLRRSESQDSTPTSNQARGTLVEPDFPVNQSPTLQRDDFVPLGSLFGLRAEAAVCRCSRLFGPSKSARQKIQRPRHTILKKPRNPQTFKLHAQSSSEANDRIDK